MSDSKVYMFPESGYDRGADTALLASTLANLEQMMSQLLSELKGGDKATKKD